MAKIIRLACYFASFLIFLIIAPKVTFAVTVTITDYPQTITKDPFNVSVSVEGAQAGTNYLRVDFYKNGTTDYFGETNNGSTWYKDSDGKQYFPITIQSGVTWTGQIQAKIGEPDISEYSEPGTYKMKVRRYTNSGNTGSEDTNSVDVTIEAAAATPTPTPTPKPTATPTPTTSTSTKSQTPTPKPSPTPSPQKAKVSTSPSPKVLGEKEGQPATPEATPKEEISPSPQPQQGESKTKVAALLTGSGAIIIGTSAAFYLWYKRTLEKS